MYYDLRDKYIPRKYVRCPSLIFKLSMLFASEKQVSPTPTRCFSTKGFYCTQYYRVWTVIWKIRSKNFQYYTCLDFVILSLSLSFYIYMNDAPELSRKSTACVSVCVCVCVCIYIYMTSVVRQSCRGTRQYWARTTANH